MTVIRKVDAVAAARSGQLIGASETGNLLELQRIQLQQEQLRYMQSLRTGKPARPAAKSSGHLLTRFVRWLV